MGYGGGDPSSDAVFGSPVLAVSKTIDKNNPVEKTKKAVSYIANGSNSIQVLSISQTSSDSAVKTSTPKAIDIKNTGKIPVVTMIGYQAYKDEDTDIVPTIYLHSLILPGETVSPPLRAILNLQGGNDDITNGSFANTSLHNLDGEVVDFTAPNTALKVTTGDNVNSTELNNTTDPVVFEINNGHDKYRVGDYIRVDNEILKVEGTFADNPTTETVADNHIVVSRGHFGSTNAAHTSGGEEIFFVHFNEYYDFDRALSGSSQLVQTDVLGRFRACNFFGYGRVVDGSAFGIVPGSILIRFYDNAYQEVMMGGSGASGGSGVSNIAISAITNSQLTASTAYAFDLTIDDSAATTISFTTDSTNLSFGGNNGIINKIQSAIDTAVRTPGNALFGYSCSVSIVGGRLRFTSNSHLAPHDGTNGSKILLADDSSGGTNLFAGNSGIFPDIVMVNAPVAPKLPDLYKYNNRTYAQEPNISEFCYDDGNGKLLGVATGTINYETGKIDMVGKSNAQFEVSVIHNSPFSGKLDADKAEANTLTAIHANVLNRRLSGELEITTY